MITPRGRRVPVQNEIAEADSLVPSHTQDMTPNPAYPAELQPRDRGRAASQEQVARIAQNLTPDLLGPGVSATEGAPIVGPDGVVESGNARTMAIQRAYADKLPGADVYRQWLQDQGHDVAGFQNPVLVRRRVGDMTPEDRAAFTREANERTTLGMGATEQAQADAKAMPDWLLDHYQGGDPLSAGNRDFVRKYLDTVAPTERGSMLGEHGELSQDGARRLENAVFAKAYEAPDVLGSLREDQDSNIRAIGGALVDAAPGWAKMRAGIGRGDIPAGVDATRDLVDAVRLVRRARQEGKPLSDLVNQRDAFSGEVSPGTRGFLDLMFRDPNYRKPASRKAISDALRFYADEASQKRAGPGLFGNEPQQGPADILAAAVRRRDGGLFGNDDVLRPGVAAEMRQSGQGGGAPESGLFDDLVPARNAQTRNAAGAGANYVPFVADKVTGTARAEPMRREAILHDFVKGMGAPLYEGRIKSGKVLGFYRPKLEEVRLKRQSDIETASHEMAHLLDDRVPEIRQQWNPATKANAAIRDELRGVSYDQSKLYEGFAEFVRLWMTQREEALNKAPNFYRWFEDFVNRSERYGPTLRNAQRDMHAWFEQDALTRARSKIGQTKDINAGLTSPFDALRQSTVDDLHGIARMERDLRGDVQAGGAYETARLTRGAAAMIEGTLTFGAPKIQIDGSVKFEGKGLEQILEPVADKLDDFLMYAVGRSANELMMQGRERLFTKAEITAMRALETPEFRQAFDEYQGWNNAILDFAQAKGIINPGQRRLWKRAAYIPFYRIDKATAGAFSATPGAWSIKALKGGTGNLRDVLQNMIGNASMLMRASLANEVRVKVADMAQLQGGAKFLAKIPTDERAVQVPADEVKRRVLEALGVTHPSQLKPEEQLFLDDIITGLSPFAQFTLRNQAPTGPNVVAALKGGKPAFFEVADPLLYRALTSLNRPGQHWLIKMLSYPRRIGQASVTLSLDFIVPNIARDTMMAGIMSKNGFRPMVDSAKGLKSRLLKDSTYREFIANGGGFSSQFLDENRFRVHLERFYGRKGIDPRTVLDAPAKLLHGLESFIDSFEVATRVGEYGRARSKGASPAKAAYEAREISTDFAMRGDSRTLGALYDTVLFMKAATVSMDRAYRGLTKDPNHWHIAAKAGLLAAASVGLAALNYGNPLYDELEDWDRDAHWHFFIPKPATIQAWAHSQPLPPLEDRYIHFRFPKLWEIGAMASIAERSFERFMEGQPKKYAGDIARIFQSTFNMSFMPQVLGPLYEQATNRLQFFNRPIETEAMQERQPFSRSNEYTSKTVRWLGKQTASLPPSLQISPARMEALLHGYLNTWATYGLTLTDAAFFDDKPDMRTDQYPALRRFYEGSPNRNSRYVTELHDLINEATEARRTVSWLSKSYRPGMDNQAEALADQPENLRYRQMNFANERLQDMSKEMEGVTGASLPDLRQVVLDHAKATGDQNFGLRARAASTWNDAGALKRLMLDRLIQERNNFAQSIVQDVNEQKGRGP